MIITGEEMSEIDKIKKHSESTAVMIMGEEKVYTHAVFCQCVLPVRALPKGTNHYEVRHGNASLMIQSGVLWDDNAKAVQMEVPSGAKARLLLPYIIDQATRSQNPEVDMGKNLYAFMQENNIKIGGANRKELQRQVNNIAASSINLGVWGETETHKYGSQKSYRIASEVSFWTEKEVSQLTFWNPTITISDEFMATLSNHRVLLAMEPLIRLQANPRAMDMYMWLSYRIRTVNRPIKISYRDLHSIFGMQTQELKNFKMDFKRSVKLALEFVPDAEVDMETDTKHIILRSNKHKLYISGGGGSILNDQPIEGGVFGELKAIGLSIPRIEKLIKEKKPQDIKKALEVTKNSIEKGKVSNPAGFFTKALQEEWVLNNVPTKLTKKEAKVEIDTDFENSIQDEDWKQVRKQFADKFGVAIFNNWIKELVLAKRAGGYIVLYGKSRFICKEVEKTYLSGLSEIWKELDSRIDKIEVELGFDTSDLKEIEEDMNSKMQTF